MVANTFVRHEACPKCRSEGNDRSGNNLAVYSDLSTYCFSCGYTEASKTKNNSGLGLEYSELMTHTTESILGKLGILPSVIKAYDITSVIREDTNEVCIKFPFHDINGVETNAQFRAVDTSTGELTRSISYSSGKVKLPLLGWKLVNANTKTVIICEGMTDTLALASVVNDPTIAVVGMSSVTAVKRVVSHVVTYADKLKVVLAFDHDDAGKEATTLFVETLEAFDENRQLYNLKFPEEYKDVREWVKALGKVELEFDTIFANGILGAADISKKVGEYFDKATDGAKLDLSFSPTLSEALRILPGKLIGVIGASGEGKSTFVEHVAIEALQQKMNTFVVSQEMLPEEFAIKLLRMVRNEPLDNPSFIKHISKEERLVIIKQIETLASTLNMTDSFGSMSIDSINTAVHKLTTAGKHPDIVIIDHLLAITTDTEVGTILDVCKELKALARAHKTCIFILTHTSKPQKARGIQQPTLNSAYGSSGIPIYCDSCVGVASDKEKNLTMIETVKLERMGGKYVNVSFDFQNYILTEQQSNGKQSNKKEESSTNSKEEFY